MKKILLCTMALLLSSNIFSQVGIGTTDPQSSLDIRSSNQATPSNSDGLLIPKVDQFPTTNPTTQQDGMLVQLTTTVGPNLPGFYYWNNPTTTWLPLASGGNSFWSRNTASGYLFPSDTSDRVEVWHNSDATGTAGTGSLEIANSLRLDGNEVVTNTGTELYLQNGNNGDLSIDFNTVRVDASTNRVGIGILPTNNKFQIYNTIAGDCSLYVSKTHGSARASQIFNYGTNNGLYVYNNNSTTGTSLYNYGNGRGLYVHKGPGNMEAARINNGGSGTGLVVFNTSSSAGTSLYNYGTGRGLYVHKGTGTGEAAYVYTEAVGTALHVRTSNSASDGITAASGGYYCDLGWATQTGSTSWGIISGNSGLNAASDHTGVEGRANWSNTSTTDKMGGLFYVSGTNGGTTGWYSPAVAAVGSIVDNTVYKIVGFGLVSTLVKDSEDNERVMVAPEAPEALFQDYGIGQLTNGRAHITLDPILTKNIAVDANHPLKVFVQLEGDCQGVYVTNKSATGFDVIELNQGQSNVSFSYQLVANRADENRGGHISKYSDMRFKPLSKKIVQKAIKEPKPEKEPEIIKDSGPIPQPKIQEEQREEESNNL